MSKIQVVCFGDSNTWGYIPNTDHQRYSESERWTALLQNRLGDGYEVHEEGLNSRTINSIDTRKGRENTLGSKGFQEVVNKYNRIDLLIIFIGTNELKISFDRDPKEICSALEKEMVQKIPNNIKTILISPPTVNENTEYCKNKYEGATEKSKELSRLYEKLAIKYGLDFIKGLNFEIGIDGIHLSKKGHLQVLQIVSKVIRGE